MYMCMYKIIVCKINVLYIILYRCNHAYTLKAVGAAAVGPVMAAVGPVMAAVGPVMAAPTFRALIKVN
jgi:hypothetical protein